MESGTLAYLDFKLNSKKCFFTLKLELLKKKNQPKVLLLRKTLSSFTTSN